MQKAGFMQLEIAFAKELNETRSIVIYVRNIIYTTANCFLIQQKYMDACASAFGFFLIGFDYIARYRSSHCMYNTFFETYDPVLWFFKVRSKGMYFNHYLSLFMYVVYIC